MHCSRKTNADYQAVFLSFKNGSNRTEQKACEFLLTYRDTPHTASGKTPAKLFMGRELGTSIIRLKLSVRETVEWQQDKMISQPARKFGKGTQSANTENRKKSIPGTIAAKTEPLSYEVEIAWDPMEKTYWPAEIYRLCSITIIFARISTW